MRGGICTQMSTPPCISPKLIQLNSKYIPNISIHMNIKYNNINDVDCTKKGVLFCQDANGKWYYVHKTKKRLMPIEIASMYASKSFIEYVCKTANLCIYRKESCQTLQNFKAQYKVVNLKWYSVNSLYNGLFNF